MSRPRGGYIGFNRVPAASAVNSAASGIWTLREAESLKRAGTWPLAPAILPTITGLQLWLDASDSATLFDATTGGSLVAADGGVARWEDKSGNARHATQSTSAQRPTRKTAIQGGLDVLRFDGSDDWMTAANVFTAQSPYTILGVFKGGGLNEGGRAFVSLSVTSEGKNGYFTYFYRTDVANNGRTIYSTDSELANISNDDAASVKYDVFHVMSAVHSASNRQWWVNGTSQGTANTASGEAVFSSAQLRVGAYFSLISPNNVYGLQGDIGEIIIYNSILSDANRGLVEFYLLAKWGIT